MLTALYERRQCQSYRGSGSQTYMRVVGVFLGVTKESWKKKHAYEYKYDYNYQLNLFVQNTGPYDHCPQVTVIILQRLSFTDYQRWLKSNDSKTMYFDRAEVNPDSGSHSFRALSSFLYAALHPPCSLHETVAHSWRYSWDDLVSAALAKSWTSDHER